MSILEITGQILLVPPFFESFGKRLIKSPKLYFTDSGLACHLLGLDDVRSLVRSPFRGPVFEGFVAAEIIKQQIGNGKAKELYFFRDQQGLEVDFVIPRGASRLWLVEAKASKTLRPSDAASVSKLAAATQRYDTESFVVSGSGSISRRGCAKPRSFGGERARPCHSRRRLTNLVTRAKVPA